MDLRLRSITFKAEGINSYEFVSPAGDELPRFTAGAHVDLRLTPTLVRSYSLINPQSERHRYLIAVRNEPQGRGGSRWIHEKLRVGDTVSVGSPRNNFPLTEDAACSILIAGGIGITPLWSIIQRLHELGRPWELYYCNRTRTGAVFLEALLALQAQGPGLVHTVFTEGLADRRLDIQATLDRVPAGAHVYCCGPPGMLAAFEKAAAGRPAETVHTEYFSATQEAAVEGGFTVVLSASGREIFVPHGRTILETLLANGIDAPNSCREEVCGACETEVIDGMPDHRDSVLSESERASNRTMMICCSGCAGTRLVLSL